MFISIGSIIALALIFVWEVMKHGKKRQQVSAANHQEVAQTVEILAKVSGDIDDLEFEDDIEVIKRNLDKINKEVFALLIKYEHGEWGNAK